METYVLGDIHGAYKALQQVLERSEYRPGTDRLVFVGDVADGWPETPHCVEQLACLDNCVILAGNHDVWVRDWMHDLEHNPHYFVNHGWLNQGGQATWDAYARGSLSTRRRHYKDYFSKMQPYFEDEQNNLYVHGGYNPDYPIDQQDPHDLCWDRDLWARGWEATAYKECFVGHTTTTRTSLVPERRANVWNVDQGAGWEGKLSLLRVSDKAFWQSDVVKTLYPNVKGR